MTLVRLPPSTVTHLLVLSLFRSYLASHIVEKSQVWLSLVTCQRVKVKSTLMKTPWTLDTGSDLTAFLTSFHSTRRCYSNCQRREVTNWLFVRLLLTICVQVICLFTDCIIVWSFLLLLLPLALLLILFMVLVMELTALYILGKCFIADPHS